MGKKSGSGSGIRDEQPGSHFLGLSSVPDPNPDPDPDPPDPHVFGPPGSFYHHAKIVRKTLIPAIL
jgi:hypothetical protein